jgi:hypothetical protein
MIAIFYEWSATAGDVPKKTAKRKYITLQHLANLIYIPITPNTPNTLLFLITSFEGQKGNCGIFMKTRMDKNGNNVFHV